jgi:hypothetical protein
MAGPFWIIRWEGVNCVGQREQGEFGALGEGMLRNVLRRVEAV